jgi:serine/threonine protein kinase
VSTIRGTPNFIPPELLGFDSDSVIFNPKAGDMWCFGETVFRMLTNTATFTNEQALFQYKYDRASFPIDVLRAASASDLAIDFVTSLMAACPAERACPLKLLDHHWLLFSHRSTAQAMWLDTDGESEERQTTTTIHEDDLTQPSGSWSRPIPEPTVQVVSAEQLVRAPGNSKSHRLQSVQEEAVQPFIEQNYDPQLDCQLVYAVENIATTLESPQVALQELSLKGKHVASLSV